MSMIDFHPAEEILIEFHQGNLPYAHELVIAAHIEMCNQCKDELNLYDAISGHFLEEASPIALNDDALDLALARIDRPFNINPQNNIPDFLKDFEIPNSISKLKFKNRYWAAPGVWIAKVENQGTDKSQAYLMYAKKGMQMPIHDHDGREITLVLQGSLEDENGKFIKGNLMQAQTGFCHSPNIGDDIDCLCFIATDNPIIPKTFLGKVLQPFARI